MTRRPLSTYVGSNADASCSDRASTTEPIVSADISIIIVNWHSKDYVRSCLNALAHRSDGASCEVVVVDNASYDGCGEMLAAEWPDTSFVQSPHNLGFAGANNLGATYARAGVLLFLNPDTEIMGSAIERLFAVVNHASPVGVVGARLLNSDGSLQTSCVQAFPTVVNQAVDSEILRTWYPNAELWGTRAFAASSESPFEVEAVSGACMMVRRSAFEAVGGFTTDYFMYGEDLDLCWKMRQAGLLNLYVNDAVVVHHGGGSSRKAPSAFSIVTMRSSVAHMLRRTQGPAASRAYRVSSGTVAVARLVLLMVVFPFCQWRGERERWRAALGKWWAILRWSCGTSNVLRPAVGNSHGQAAQMTRSREVGS